MQRRIPVVDLCCGAGGASVGFEQAGGRVVLGIDRCDAALTTFRARHPEAWAIFAELGGDGLSVEDVLALLPRRGAFHVHIR